MSVQLNISIPDDLMEWLTVAADRDFRTPQGHVLWLIKHARDRDSRHGPDGAARQEAREALFAELQKLHRDAGVPSLRTVAQRITRQGGIASHTAVHSALRGKSLPSLALMEGIVTVLDGDVEHFRALWIQARDGHLTETYGEEENS